jgi:hypothetical protein
MGDIIQLSPILQHFWFLGWQEHCKQYDFFACNQETIRLDVKLSLTIGCSILFGHLENINKYHPNSLFFWDRQAELEMMLLGYLLVARPQ